MIRLSWGALALAAVLAAPAWVAAQDPPPDSTAQQAATELVFEREVFRSPEFKRRNPFRPLLASDSGGPRFTQLRLIGIIFSDDPSLSVAIVGTSQVNLSEDATAVTLVDGQSWYLKVGQSVGNIRIVEIRREQVVVEVEEFGLTEQKIMQLTTRRLGGTP